MRFGNKGKHSPWYVCPYQTFKCNGKVNYVLDLLKNLATIHPILHVSIVKKCFGDPTSIFPLEGLGVDECFFNKEVLEEILYHQVKKLRYKEIAFMKVLWRNQLGEGATWEAKADVMS